MSIKFKLSSQTISELHSCLYNGDGKETVAFVLCGTAITNEQVIILAHEVVALSSESYLDRKSDFVRWSTFELKPLLDRAEKESLSIVKFHCHPSGYDEFSNIDNESDKELFPSIYDWLGTKVPCLSAILLPDDRVIARHIDANGNFFPVSTTVVGDIVKNYSTKASCTKPFQKFEERNLQTFGSLTRDTLSQMKIAVIGCSGTGSPVVEQLNRLGVGELILVDPDKLEHKNLNRVTNTTMRDAELALFKVDALQNRLAEIGLPTRITAIPRTLLNREVIKIVSECDFIFGCVDSSEARVAISRISSFYLVPYIDIGICLDADGSGGVRNISGKIGYFQPGMSDHLTRRSILPSTLEAESLKRTNPDEYLNLLEEGYIKGVSENSPAVISVNTYASSLAILEFLARVHEYRNEPNSNFAQQTFCLVNNFFEEKSEEDFLPSKELKKYVGRGDLPLLLDMPSLSVSLEAA
ncbi:ThiF family adenylyltransferase [Psychrosphaera sp. 1_MG-2023]|uniref:ThiF family adenylyltransferase n=1 Tax=Psychrosphaera sp. 1_MG-2023 TaxID=3062643 RepID=UPI0026E1D2CA|nr:ThiF family adenylyltransferase [Psychrosphaera sp. 1_MG-2023]MDO6719710.1 ThiF family adenylyltransferase [Psychrosphaera sp. 1_MG-2023]